MAPEQIAEHVFDDWYANAAALTSPTARNACIVAIAAALHAAIEAERDACAQVAYAQYRNAVKATQSEGEWARCATAIFRAIRKRDEDTIL